MMQNVLVQLYAGLPWQRRHSTRRDLFTSKLDCKEEPVKFYILSIALYGAESGTLRTVDQQYVGSFEMWCRRRMETSWTDRVRNKEVGLLHRDKEERNLLYTIKQKKAIQIGHALRRNCLLDHGIEENIEGKI
jgi:hypothetical protein